MGVPPTETLALTEDGPVLHVTLNRPEVRNAMSLQMVGEIAEAIDYAEANDAVRVLVFRGSGGHFCAGADLKDMAASRQAPASDGEDPVKALNAKFGRMVVRSARTSLATVAVLEGAVMGGGFGLACVVDVALAASTAKFRLPETGLGIVPAGIMPVLLERLGYSQAKRLAVTGGSLDGAEAARVGLVHEVFEDTADLDAALAKNVGQILRCAPGALAATKALVAKARFTPPEELVDHAAEVFSAAARGPEGMEGVMAFLQKRKPSWAPSGD